MKERRHKVHFKHSRSEGAGLCGLDGHITHVANMMTCRICMYRYLGGQASWAPHFLNSLRGKVNIPSLPRESERDKNLRERGYHVSVGPDADRPARRSPLITLEYIDTSLRQDTGSGQAQPVSVPAGLTAPMDGKVKGLGNGFARALSQQCDPQEIVRVLLAVDAPGDGPVQPVMQDGGPATDTGGVQKGKVAEDSGDTG